MGGRTTSSRKSTQGASLAARLKHALTMRTLSPTHLDVTVLGAIARNDAPHSAAVALASRVFPVPAMATGASDFCLTRLTLGNAVCTFRSSRAG